MISQKVLIYIALVVLIVQVAVSSAGGSGCTCNKSVKGANGAVSKQSCKCSQFDSAGNCRDPNCVCTACKKPASKSTTIPSNGKTNGAPAPKKATLASRTPLAPKNGQTTRGKATGRVQA